MGVIKAAIGDCLLTFMWVFCASCIGIMTHIVASTLGVAQGLPTLGITSVILFILLFVFGIIGEFLGGASFNPTATAAFHAAGLGGPESIVTVGIRFPAQAVGAVGGAIAVLELMPKHYKHMLDGPSLKVDWHTGAIAEGVLTFAITLVVLVVIIRGPNSSFVKNLLMTIATVAIVDLGAAYTGPSLNPANAFGWAYIYNKHNTLEQFYVYWVAPFIGAILAAWVFRFAFPPPVKQKKA